MIKIIFIIPFAPKYAEYADKPRPKYNWDTKDGQWVGIWGYDWGDLHLKSLVEYYNNYDCEVWQPDLRADKIYSVELCNKLVHRNFPAKMIKRFSRFKLRKEMYSQSIIDELKKYDDYNTVIMLPATVRTKWMKHVINFTYKGKHIYYIYINDSKLLPYKINTLNPFKAFSTYLVNKQKLKWLKKMNVLLTSYSNPDALSKVEKINPNLKMIKFVWGFDYDFWYSIIDKATARRNLNIPNEAFVILLSQRLVPEYQVDRFIEVIAQIKPVKPFVCYITGFGLPDYKSYLQGLVERFGLNNKICFVGYVCDEELRNYMIAADLFVAVPTIFGGSGGALKEMAIGRPIFTVSSGSTYYFLKEQNAGIFVSPTDYEEWRHKLESIINGEIIVKTVKREIVMDHYSWKKTAEQTKKAIDLLFEEN
jgi:glycosyltransferase involved in cell wall biosynthesis